MEVKLAEDKLFKNTNFQDKEAEYSFAKDIYKNNYMSWLCIISETSFYVMGYKNEKQIRPLFAALYQLWTALGIKVNIVEGINDEIEDLVKEIRSDLSMWENKSKTSDNEPVPFPDDLCEKLDKFRDILFITMQKMGLGIHIRKKISERTKVRRIITKE